MPQLFPNNTASCCHLFKQNFTTDSHPLEETLFHDIFVVQSLKCEITFPWGFCVQLCLWLCFASPFIPYKLVWITCLSPRNVAKRGVCKAVWLKRLFPIKAGSKHLKKLDNIQIPDGHQWLVSIMIIDRRNWGRAFLRAKTWGFSSPALNLGSEL